MNNIIKKRVFVNNCLNFLLYLFLVHSIKLYFKEQIELISYQHQYSRCFRKIYNNINNYKDVKEKLLQKHTLIDSAIFDSLKIQVELKRSLLESSRNKKVLLIQEYEKEMSCLDVRTRRFHKLNKKIKYLKRTLSRNIVFGSKSILSKITYNKNMFNKTKDETYLNQYNKHLKEFKDNRLLPYFSVGRACEKGNRKFNFDLVNKTITFKPSKNNHFNIKFNCSNGTYKTLCKLQELIDNKAISVTVSLTSNSIVLTYDNEKLNGYSFKDIQCKKEQAINKDERKAIWLKYLNEQKQRKLLGKKKDVFAGIDLNPEYIGLTIRNKQKILYTKCYDLNKLLKETIANKTEQIKFNLAHCYKDIFKLCKHFKVSTFTTEDLNLSQNNDIGRSANRKTKNLWCRVFQQQLILKYTQNQGIEHVEINPAYSSFVGNMANLFFDPISASAEIVRRGMLYKKEIIGDWYLGYKWFLEDNLQMYVPLSELMELSVPALFKITKSLNLRYRRLAKTKSKFKLIKTSTFLE